METRRYKTHGAIGDSKWQTGSLVEMLMAMPRARSYVDQWRVVPPIHVLNEILSTGMDDAGMSGGCEWKPFQLSGVEYANLLEELLTSPDLNCERDLELEGATTWKSWEKKLWRKYRSRLRPS